MRVPRFLCTLLLRTLNRAHRLLLQWEGGQARKKRYRKIRQQRRNRDALAAYLKEDRVPAFIWDNGQFRPLNQAAAQALAEPHSPSSLFLKEMGP